MPNVQWYGNRFFSAVSGTVIQLRSTYTELRVYGTTTRYASLSHNGTDAFIDADSASLIVLGNTANPACNSSLRMGSNRIGFGTALTSLGDVAILRNARNILGVDDTAGADAAVVASAFIVGTPHSATAGALLDQAGTATGFLFAGADTATGAFLEGITTAGYEDPAAPAASRGRLYFKTVGGKVALMARFPTGAVQQVAIEP